MTLPYRSPLPFSPDPSPALALYCSDSRFDEHCEHFIIHALGIEPFDEFVVPGGAAWLVWDWRDFGKQRIAREQVSFLVEAHQVQRVVLIAHEDCGFYRKRHPELSAPALKDKQLEDLHLAMRELRALASHLTFDAFYASVQEGAVVFEPVPVPKR